MRVYLVQHGEAIDKAENPDRPLTADGKRAVDAVGNLLAKAGIKPTAVWHSGKLRAEQTARRLGDALGIGSEVREHDFLGPKDSPGDTIEAVKAAGGDNMLVGHLPHMEKFAACLITGNEDTPVVRFQKGGVACLEQDDKGAWAVAWFIVPSLAH